MFFLYTTSGAKCTFAWRAHSLELGWATIHQWGVAALTELVNFLYPPRSARQFSTSARHSASARIAPTAPRPISDPQANSWWRRSNRT
jgi:hypothetical protein